MNSRIQAWNLQQLLTERPACSGYCLVVWVARSPKQKRCKSALATWAPRYQIFRVTLDAVFMQFLIHFVLFKLEQCCKQNLQIRAWTSLETWFWKKYKIQKNNGSEVHQVCFTLFYSVLLFGLGMKWPHLVLRHLLNLLILVVSFGFKSNLQPHLGINDF